MKQEFHDLNEDTMSANILPGGFVAPFMFLPSRLDAFMGRVFMPSTDFFRHSIAWPNNNLALKQVFASIKSKPVYGQFGTK